MNTVKNIDSNNSNEKIISTLMRTFQSLSIIFIGLIIVNFIVNQ